VLLHEQRQPRALQQPAAPRGAAPQRRGLPRRQLVRVRGGDGCAEAVEAADLAAAVLRERQPLVQRGLQLLGATGRRRQREDAAAVAAFPRAREARHAFARGGALAAARRPLHQHGAAAQLHNGALLRRQAVGQPHKAAHEGPAPRCPEEDAGVDVRPVRADVAAGGREARARHVVRGPVRAPRRHLREARVVREVAAQRPRADVADAGPQLLLARHGAAAPLVRHAEERHTRLGRGCRSCRPSASPWGPWPRPAPGRSSSR